MRVFVTGATGFIGSAVVKELIEHGHDVIGLARSDAAAASLVAAGATPQRGSVQDLASVRAGAARADGAIHTAFFHEFSHASLGTRMRVITGGSPRKIVDRFLAATLAADRSAIEAIGTSLNGSDRPLVATFATMALTPGRVGTEDGAIDSNAVGGPRGGTERTMRELATRGVRSSIVRLPPVVHGDGDRGGFIPQMIKAARKNKVSSYALDGGNRWPAVHRLDAAHLFVQALEHGDAGSVFHGVAEDGIPVIDIATAIGRGLDLPVSAATPKQIKDRFGFIAPFIPVDNPVTSASTRTRLGWEPTHPALLDDLTHGTYFSS